MQSDMIERGDPLFAVFGYNPRRATFTIFSYFVAHGSFAADGGLLQPTKCVKTTPQKTRFRSVNLYKEFAYKSQIRVNRYSDNN